MYTPSKNYLNCHIAGFAYWDGLGVMEDLKIGTALSLVCEPDCPYDPKAVALYYEETKIGYVPRLDNSDLYTLLFFGHTDVFEVKISAIYPDKHPEQRYSIAVSVRDNRVSEEL